MKASAQTHALYPAALLAGIILFTTPAAFAEVIFQTINQGFGTNWNQASWGSPAAVPTAGNDYVTPNGFDVRTPDSQSPSTFLGDQLQIESGGRFVLKNGGAGAGVATVNLVLNGGSITHNTVNANTVCAIAGTIQVPVSSAINSVAGANTRDVWIQSALSGTGNLSVSLVGRSLVLFGTNSGFSGNWTINSGLLEISTNAVDALGSGTVTLANATNALVFNSPNDLVVTNAIGGAGFVRKLNSGAVVLTANNTFTGGVTNQAGLLVLAGSGTQNFTRVDSNAVTRIANSAALPVGAGVRVNSFDTQTGRLELSNNVTLGTGLPIELGMRGNATPALRNVHGNNIINDQVSVSTGGTLPARIEVDAGTTLNLVGGITSTATGTRSVGLQGDGNGTVTGYIDNGSATTVSVYKDGSGTWTLDSYNYYTGPTIISGGVLKLGAFGSIASSSAIQVEGAGRLDATLVSGGLMLNFGQILRGNGAVLGDVATSSGSVIEVGLTNQYGPLSLSNSLALNGSDTLRFDVSSVTNDILHVTGTLTRNGPTTIEVAVPDGFADNGTYRLINYSGTLQGAGSFTLVPPASRQSFALDTTTAGQVNLVITGNPTNLVWSGDNAANYWDVGASQNWNSQTEVFYNADHVTFDDSGSASPDVYLPAAVSPGAVTVSNIAQAYTFTGAGIITADALTKRGGNVLALANDGNAFSGPINIEAGTLSLGNGGGSGSLGNGPVINNGELLLNRSTGGVSVNGQVSGTGTVRVTGGGGTLNLTASNTYSGVTTVESGCQLVLHNDFALGVTNSGTVVQAGGTVRFVTLGNWTVDEPLEINGDGPASSAGALYANTISNRATWTGPITLGSASRIRIVNPNVRMTLANTVTGNQTDLHATAVDAGSFLTFSNALAIGNLATLTKDGSGTLILAGSSNLAGGTVINGGPFIITTTNTPQIGDITVNGGTLQLGTGAEDGAMPDGAINLAGGSTRLVLNSSNSFVLNQELSGAGGLTLSNYAKLTINSSNTFAGSVTTGSGTPIPGGTITLFNSSGLGDGLSAKTVTLTRAEVQLTGGLVIPAAISFTTSGGALMNSPGGELIPLRNIAGNNTVEGAITLGGGGNDTVIASDSGTLTLNGTITPNISARTLLLRGAGNGVINGALNDNGANIPALTMQGSGTWTLNAANDYSGATTIQNGTLALGSSATIANTPTILLQSNAVFDVSAIGGGFTLGGSQILSGNGTVVGSLASIGAVSPGTSVGTLNFANSAALFGTTLMELDRTNAQNADLIVASALTFGGTLTVTNIGEELQAGDTFNLFDGPIGGEFAVTNLPALASTNLFWDLSQLGTQGIISVGPNAAPQPGIVASRNGANLDLQVVSQSGFDYILETTPQLNPASWTGIETNAGGGTLNFTVPINPAASKEFFRIRVE